MDHKEDDFRKICFHCASIYEMEDGHAGKSMKVQSTMGNAIIQNPAVRY